jgi:hypothetical protein
VGNCAGVAVGTIRVTAAQAAGGARGSMRFAGMDANGDGVITRAEWRGNDQSFRAQDGNGDGILSGNEVRPGAARAAGGDPDWIDEDRFAFLDINNNGRVERSEWNASPTTFEWLDRNNDNVLTRTEVDGNERVPADLFVTLDRNGDQRISPTEWYWSRAAFDRRDVNHDGVLTRRELGAADTASSSPVAARTVVVRGNQPWTDTGLVVRAGDLLSFDASGTVRLSGDAEDLADPHGARSGRLAGESPMPNELGGALIARTGTSPAFFVGSSADQIRASESGRLYLGVNDDYTSDNSGEFRVAISVRR